MEQKKKLISEIMEAIRAKENPTPILEKFGLSSVSNITPQLLNEYSLKALTKLLSELA